MTLPELPHNLDAEKATLGSILLNREAIIQIAPYFQPGYCYHERHHQIAAAMLHCYAQRIPPDTRTVSEELRRRGQLEQIGGVAYLSDLVDSVPTAYHVEYYARIVERAAILRRLITAGGQIAALGYDERPPLDETIGRAQQTLLDAVLRPDDTALVPIGEIASAYYETLGGDRASGTPTSFWDFDDLSGGLHAGDLIVLAARPGVGKTSWALQIAEAVAQQGLAVPIFSMEMSREQLFERLAAQRCRLDLMAVRQRALCEDDLALLIADLGRIADLPLYIDDAGTQTPTHIRNAAQRFRAEKGPIGCIVVDYLQLMQAPEYAANRTQEVGAISRALKRLARELRCPVLALAQLNRAVEGRASHVPLLSDLRESGQIEADADVVIFIHRPELYDKDAEKHTVELHIAKHRGGPLGVVPLRFEASSTRFQNLAPRASWQGGRS
jgi:replicative DNA helicase